MSSWQASQVGDRTEITKDGAARKMFWACRLEQSSGPLAIAIRLGSVLRKSSPITTAASVITSVMQDPCLLGTLHAQPRHGAPHARLCFGMPPIDPHHSISAPHGEMSSNY